MSEQDCTGGLAPEDRTIAASGLGWHYLEWTSQDGRGPNILLVHGITSDAHSWWRLGAELARAGSHVIAVDLPGHGQTEVGSDTQWASTAEYLAGFVTALGWDQVGYHLAGHSWGGVVSLLLANGYAAGLKRLALLDPALHLSEENTALNSHEAGGEVGLPKRSPEEYYAQLRAENDWQHDCDYYWKSVALAAYDQATVRDFWLQNAGQNIIPVLGEIEIPVLLVISDESEGGVLTPEDQKACRAVLRPETSQVVYLPGVGHDLHREDYVTTVEAVAPFLLA